MQKMKRKSNGRIRSFLLGCTVAAVITLVITHNTKPDVQSCDRIKIATEEIAYVIDGWELGYPAPMPMKPGR